MIHCHLAHGTRGALVRSRDVGSHRTALLIAMIPKTFILTKEIRAIRAKSLRDNKSLRDHGRLPGGRVEPGSPANAGTGVAERRDRAHPDPANSQASPSPHIAPAPLRAD